MKEGITLIQPWLEEKLRSAATSVAKNDEEMIFYYNDRPYAYLDNQRKKITLKCIEVMIPVLVCQFETSMKASRPGFVEVDLTGAIEQGLLEDLVIQAIDLALL